MRKIFISAGHSLKKSGAQGNGYKEELLAIELRDLIIKELKEIGINATIDDNNNALVESINFFSKLINPNSIALDIHWNASANALATGVETLVPSTYTKFEYDFAAALSDIVSKTLILKKRGTNGVKTEAESHHGKLGWMRLNCENILLETCFISNKSDMDSYQKNKITLAKSIAKLLKEYSNK